MGKYVKLPIFDEDGLETGEVLSIDLRHFLGAASNELAHNYIKVEQAVDVSEELDVLDRIVHGLSRRDRKTPFNKGRLESISLVSKEEGIGEITLVDVVSEEPNVWQTIPRYIDWEINIVTHEVRHGKSHVIAPLVGEDTQNPYVVISYERRTAPVVLSWIVSQIKK